MSRDPRAALRVWAEIRGSARRARVWFPSSRRMHVELATTQSASTLQPAMRLTPIENGTSARAISTAAPRKGAPGR